MHLAARKDIDLNDMWDLSPLFPSLDAWKNELKNLEALNWQEMSRPFQERATLSAHDIRAMFDLFFSNERRVKKLYTYAHLAHDEDTSLTATKEAYKQALAQYVRLSEAFSWIEPKILSMSQEQLSMLLKASELATYHTVLERTIRLKAHTLSEKEELLLAMASKATGTGGKAFTALSDCDFHFQDALDMNGTAHPVTHASYSLLLRSNDRMLRKNAFLSLHSRYSEYKNTLAELLSGQIEQHWFYARAKNYSSCLEAALFPKGIDTKVYRSLITSVRQHLPLLHSYMNIRKEMLQVDELHMWDLYVPLISETDISMKYEEAMRSVLSSLAPLGKEYVETLRRGFEADRWVDKYENKAKRSGAYSSGCYDSHPYILMNYNETLRNVFTLSHEAGHSMHSHMSRTHQPYHYSEYEIFVAEVASTFHEALLAQHLLETASNDQERAYILNEKIEDIRGTLFRQTMFAEFELTIHEAVEQNKPLTPAFLEETYLKLNRDYFGPDVVIDDFISVEWARIPHFYYNYYVYQYATGISAALALVRLLQKEGDPARERYMHFLQGGNSLFPVDILLHAGVDMRSPLPVDQAMDYFGTLLEKFHLLALEYKKC